LFLEQKNYKKNKKLGMSFCVFCHGEDGPFVTPCVCAGSVGSIHRACIIRFGRAKCPTCRTPYMQPFALTWAEALEKTYRELGQLIREEATSGRYTLLSCRLTLYFLCLFLILNYFYFLELVSEVMATMVVERAPDGITTMIANLAPSKAPRKAV
jgi:E3 ubiquitin-protein ligase DOA10